MLEGPRQQTRPGHLDLLAVAVLGRDRTRSAGSRTRRSPGWRGSPRGPGRRRSADDPGFTSSWSWPSTSMTQTCSASPSCGAARPTPGASRIECVRSSSSSCRYRPKLSTAGPSIEVEGRRGGRWDGRSLVVVRGAVPAKQARFPILLSNRASGSPAHGSPMVAHAWLRCLRIADGAAKSVQAEPIEPVLGPLAGLPGTQVATLTLHEEAPEPVHDVTGRPAATCQRRCCRCGQVAHPSRGGRGRVSRISTRTSSSSSAAAAGQHPRPSPGTHTMLRLDGQRRR